MRKKLLKKIITFILITAFMGRIASPFALVYAQTAPEAPTAPSAPTGPSAPEAPTAPSAPTGPSAPEAPTAPSAPTGPTSPSAPDYTYVPPTSGPAPSAPTLPTGEPLTANDPLPTGESAFTLPQTYDPYPTGSGSNGYENSSSTSSETSGSGSVNDPYNYLTGPGSYNFGQETITKSMEEVNKNLAEMKNKIDSMTTTGFNFADLNTLSGEILTGDIISQVNLMNKLNSNMSGLGTFSTFNLYGNYAGDIALNFTDGSPLSAFAQASETVSKNSVTGPLSENYAISDGNFTVKEANGNDATLSNDINLGADTGNNSASTNTGDGIVDTGDATALANIVNMVNSNINVVQWLFAVVNIFGDLAGNIILPQENGESETTNGGTATVVGNDNTGPGSVNYSSATSNTTAEFTNINNADIVSNLNVDANTGNNSASVNTGGGYVSTGMADASVSNSTVANTNTVDEDGTVWLVIVNEMGKWVGHIVGNPYGVNTASNSLPVSTETGGFGEQSFSVSATNDNTGPMSTNVATISQNNETSVENVNNAAIENNITAVSNTGNNEAKYNTGAGVIETGDANTGVSLLNMANTNVTAKKLVVLFVNVIGSFVGDIVPTGEWEQAYNNSYYQGTGSNSQNTSGFSPLPTLGPPLPTIAPVGGISEVPALPDGTQINGNNEQNQNYYTYYYYYPEEAVGENYYYYPEEYVNSVKKVAIQKNKVNYLQNQYSNANNSGSNQTLNGKTRVLKRGTTVSANFVKAIQSSGPGILIGGISLKVTNTWLLFVPLALFIYVWRRKNRINIDVNRYINMLLDVIL